MKIKHSENWFGLAQKRQWSWGRLLCKNKRKGLERELGKVAPEICKVARRRA